VDRVRDLLDVGAAAILLLDVHVQQIVATGAKGRRRGCGPGSGRPWAAAAGAGRRPGRDGRADPAGETRRAGATVRADAPGVVCATVMSEVAESSAADDVAVLAVRRHG
jgi:hypothetical protein